MPRPDPRLVELQLTASTAEVWNADPADLRTILAEGVFVGGGMRRIAEARLALAQPDGDAADVDRPTWYPRTVPFPLADRNSSVLGGAVGLVACHFADSESQGGPGAPAGDAMCRAATDVLRWFGQRTGRSLRTEFHVPPGSEGTSASLAVLIAALLVSEPDLAPPGWGTDAAAHRFAATGGWTGDDRGVLSPVATETLPAKLAVLAGFGYRTLFTVGADPTTLPEPPPGLEVELLSAEPARALAQLRRWFVARLPWRRRAARLLRRLARPAAAAALVFIGGAALAWHVERRNLAAAAARELVRQADARSQWSDHAEVADLLRRARALAPDEVAPARLAEAEARAATVIATRTPSFAGIGWGWHLDRSSADVVGTTPTELVRWQPSGSARRWAVPLDDDPVTSVAISGGGVLLVGRRSGAVELRDAATGAARTAMHVPFVPAGVAIARNGELGVVAGEDGAVVWRPGAGPAVALAGASFELGDAIVIDPDGRCCAVVGADGRTRVWEDPLSSTPRSWPPLPADGEVALLAVGGTVAWWRATAAGTVTLHGRDVLAGEPVGTLELAGGEVPLAAAWDPDAAVLAVIVAAETADGGTAVALLTWNAASVRRVALAPALGEVRDLAWQAPGRLAALAFTGHAATMAAGPTQFAGRPTSLGTLVTIDADTGRIVAPALAFAPRCAAVDAQRGIVVAASAGGRLGRWSLPDLELRSVHDVRGAPIGCWLRGGRVVVLRDDGVLVAVDEDGMGTVLLRVSGPVHVAALSDSGRWLLVVPGSPPAPPVAGTRDQPWISGRDGSGPQAALPLIEALGDALRVDLSTRQVDEIGYAPTDLQAVAIRDDGAVLLAGREHVELRLVETGADAHGIRLTVTSSPTAAVFGPDGSRVAVGDAAGRTHVLIADGLQPFKHLDPVSTDQPDTPVTALAFVADGVGIVVGHGQVRDHLHPVPDPSVRHWDLVTAEISQEWVGHSGGVAALAPCSWLGAILSVGRDRSMSLLRVAPGGRAASGH